MNENENILDNFLENKPTYLAYEDELKLIDIMMKLPMDWLIKNEDEFFNALNALVYCHTLGFGFLSVEESDDIIFENFCNWLREVEEKTHISVIGYIDDLSPEELELDNYRRGKKINSNKSDENEYQFDNSTDLELNSLTSDRIENQACIFESCNIKEDKMIQSKYPVPKNINKLISQLELKRRPYQSYVNFLKQYNVIDFYGLDYSYYIDYKGKKLSLEVILGFSEKAGEDLIALNKMCLNRIPKNYFAIARVNHGDLLCMASRSIYYWNRKVNDLHFDMKVKYGYLMRNTALMLVADSFDQFLSMITRTKNKANYTQNENEFNLPDITFPIEALELWEENPKRIFRVSERDIPIYIEKLEASERGRAIIGKFKTLTLTEEQQEVVARLKEEGLLADGIFE
ncbi:SMI1/KNR4 family protein [Gilliamella apicola]|uniref:SMI1/KNR4 family protein n=1 Tax=Gilliamella apicola TaxID=1196095 RepID=UPI0015C4F197|nr:SMI1/KNR4 family protein [Gilliamella apicola]WLS90734.1 SMI1/KNR4 family protein [Gilliamella apicola]